MSDVSLFARRGSLGAALGCVIAIGCGTSEQRVTGSGGQNGAGGQKGTVCQGETGGQSDAGNSLTSQVKLTFPQTVNNKVDILFVLMDWTGDPVSQQKLYAQLPSFLSILKSGPVALDLHIAVTTADMGAPSDAQSSFNCTAQGDAGQFQSAAKGTCTDTTLAAGATYLTDDGNGTTNFTDPIGSVLQCISFVGDSGCGFGQPLAAAVHALGADDIQQGAPTPPSTNAGFLRPDAFLAIILLANRDDCSAPTGTELFSLQGQPDNLANPLGPLQYYRCNQYGHLCVDPGGTCPIATPFISPPLTPPSDAQGTTAAPSLDLGKCQDNDTASGLLTPVSTLVSQIKALKAYPDYQILVAAVTAPASPYTVAWNPARNEPDAQPGELWPELEFSCGPAGGDNTNPNAAEVSTDGSFGEPSVRLSQFVNSFSNSVLVSNCDPSYAPSMMATATKIARMPVGQNCLNAQIQNNTDGLPNCTVVAEVTTGTTTNAVQYPNCADTANTPPCWTLNKTSQACTGVSFSTTDNPGAPSSLITVSCTVCDVPLSGVPGC
jgi:hypothetical protein